MRWATGFRWKFRQITTLLEECGFRTHPWGAQASIDGLQYPLDRGASGSDVVQQVHTPLRLSSCSPLRDCRPRTIIMLF